MKKTILFCLLAIIGIASFAQIPKLNKYTFIGKQVFKDTVVTGHIISLDDTLVYKVPHSHDTISLRAGTLALDTSATTDTITLKFPTGPYDGNKFYISTVGAVTFVRFINGTPSNAPTSLSANSTVGYVYSQVKNKFYRRQ